MVLLSLVLSVGVVGSEFLARVIFASAGGGMSQGARAILISAPMAVLAACIGLRLASRMGLDGPGWAAALNKAAVVSLIFTLLAVPSAAAYFAIGRFLGAPAVAASAQADPGVLVAAPGLIGQLLHALTDALMGQAVGLPMLFAALLVLGRYRARHPSGHARLGSGRAGLARTVYIAVAVGTLGYFVVPPSGMALASSTSPASAAITAGVNPCTTAPHDTFNVSAINVTMTLNRYGVNDPNAFMYVLDKNIPAVRAEEASGDVSIGLGNDPIQPLVIRAHEGDCVTVNFTNRTTFGVAAMDEPPLPDPADGCNNGTLPPACDGSLARTAPENLAWNVDGLPGLSAADVSSAVGKNPDNTAAPGQTQSYTVYVDPALGEGAHMFHSTGDTRQTQGHGLFGALISEPPGSQWLDPKTLQPIDSGWDAVIQMPAGGGPSFREFALLFHEIGDEGYRQIMEKPGTTCSTGDGETVFTPASGENTPGGCELPVVDHFTGAYRPCSKAINYRSECFFERLLTLKKNGFLPDESQTYGSYMNGDMATPQPQMYVGDPYKIRLVNAGAEMAHVFHEHGGGIRWLRNPKAANPDIAGGLEKHPP
jgi:manganese oxidase